jgi:hypothetical protein
MKEVEIVINYNRILMQQPDGREDCNKLQQGLDAAARWERDWLMAFHPDKCSVLSVERLVRLGFYLLV